MDQPAAIVTGGLRGLGRAMTFGLARTGVCVLAVGHIDSDLPEMRALPSNAETRTASPASSPTSAGRRNVIA